MNPVETYCNTKYANQPCNRWWLVHERLLIGGSVIDLQDAEHLQKDLGIGAVLNVEREHTDVGYFDALPLLELPTVDDGTPKPIEWWAAGVSFCTKALRNGLRVYVHCQMGGSRSPAMGYGILRSAWKYNAENALGAVREKGVPSYGDHPVHVNYMNSYEVAAFLMKEIWS